MWILDDLFFSSELFQLSRQKRLRFQTAGKRIGETKRNFGREKHMRVGGRSRMEHKIEMGDTGGRKDLKEEDNESSLLC